MIVLSTKTVQNNRFEGTEGGEGDGRAFLYVQCGHVHWDNSILSQIIITTDLMERGVISWPMLT